MELLQCSQCSCELVIGLSCETLPHIECQDCPNQPLFCLACFTNRHNNRQHSNLHQYAVMESFHRLASPFIGDWSQGQDLALLQGVEKLGLGNWQDIAALALNGGKTPQACQSRFQELRLALGENSTEVAPMVPKADDIKLNAEMKAKSDAATHMPGAHLIGYSVLREDFDNVFANEFESHYLQDMQFDDDQERLHVDNLDEYNKLKLEVLRNYNLRLDEREYRKSVVLRRSLLDFPRMQEVRTRMNNAPADVVIGELDYFAKFTSSYDQFLKFRSQVFLERQLRQELVELKLAQSVGVHTVEQMAEFNSPTAKRLKLVSSSTATIPDLIQQGKIPMNTKLACGTSTNQGEIQLHLKE
ncbi:hypothetical protein BASA81_005353 [Batrachochytrium salamandrivorans]|nr:hypothetical protein BASA81_005353 [Batrachochytrium salamandrivorans]